MKKKILGILLLGVLVISFAGCGNKSTSNQKEDDQNNYNETGDHSNNTEENNNEVNEETKEENTNFTDWTQMIHCDYLPKYDTNSYMDYYLKNNKVVRIERLFDYGESSNEKRNNKVQDLKDQGFKDVQIVNNDIKVIITSEDTLWKEMCGECSANDVYREAENNLYELGMTCSTEDNN